MNDTLDTLCSVLDDELERQGTVLAVLEAQQQAIRVQAVEELEARTEALGELIREAVQAEAERQCVLRQVVEHFDLPEERQTMTDLIAVAPEPWRSRMRDFQTQIREIVKKTQEVTRTNRRVLRHSLQVVDRCIDTLHQCQTAVGPDYDASGHGPHVKVRGPALLDQKG